jgi:hypothetical protein
MPGSPKRRILIARSGFSNLFSLFCRFSLKIGGKNEDNSKKSLDGLPPDGKIAGNTGALLKLR